MAKKFMDQMKRLENDPAIQQKAVEEFYSALTNKAQAPPPLDSKNPGLHVCEELMKSALSRCEGMKAKALDYKPHSPTMEVASADGSTTDPQGVALDLLNGKVYWTDTSAVRRADLDGSNAEALITGLTSPGAISVDPYGIYNKGLYWGDRYQRPAP